MKPRSTAPPPASLRPLPHGIQCLIVTGMSGAGKSVVMKALEDLGVFAVDNVPLRLLPQLADLYQESGHRLSQIAAAVDIRSGALLDEFTGSVQGLARRGIKYQILFLDADDETLLHRFSETRRRHPLGRRLLEAIREERRRLRDVRAQADKIIDTSQLSASRLKEILAGAIRIQKPRGMTVTVISFGFKFGPPLDADLLFDVRFLPNPNYVRRLRPQNGTRKSVRDYVFRFPVARRFLKALESLLTMTIPEYQKEGKSYLTVGVGCTGGRHRSVAIAEALARSLHRARLSARVVHRDISRDA